MLVCPKCGYKAKKGAEFCRKCGAHLSKKPDICPKCGNAVKKDATFCRKCGANLGKVYKAKKKVPVAPLLIGGAVGAIILVIVLLVLLFAAVVVLAGGLQAPTNMTVEIDQADCGSMFRYTVQITDAEGEGIGGQQISAYADDELYEKFKTDQNGLYTSSKKVPSDWCGRTIDFTIDYGGDITHGPASSDIAIRAKVPTYLEMTILAEPVNNTWTAANVSLFSALDDSPVAGRTVMVTDTVSGQAMTDASGFAEVQILFNKTGYHYVKAVFEGDSYYLPAETNVVEVEVIPQSCSDGTYVGYCSSNYPGYYCGEGQVWIANCSLCSCGSSLVCYNNTCMTAEERDTWLIYDLQDSMVYVEHSYGTGSGVIIEHTDGKTIIVSNRHVVEGAEGVSDIEITTNSQQTITASEVLVAPSDMDLAIIKIRGTYGTPATAGSWFSQGQGVIALGSPLGLQGSVSEGIISNAYYDYTDSDYEHIIIQTDAAINPGNSGGGLFLKSTGELIGINSFVYVSDYGAEGLGFAIYIESFLNMTHYDNWNTFQPILRCSDGTPYGYCSYTYSGKYCSYGNLIDKCSWCGCAEGEYCLDDDTCFSCSPGYTAWQDDNGDGFCCATGWSAWSEQDGDGFCCRPGWSAWMDEDGEGFCCPPGQAGYYDGTCS